MIYTSDNLLPVKEGNKEYLFLAGSMDLERGSTWRSFLIMKLSDNENFHFLDPTNKNHDILTDGEMEAHVGWELQAMKMSDRIVLNFLTDSLSPISLIELGMYVASNKMVVVCPLEFYKRKYIETLCNTYQTPIVSSLDEVIEFLSKEKINNIKNS